MPNPQEIDHETREALARLGFELCDVDDVAFVCASPGRVTYIWFPGAFEMSRNQWVADNALPYDDLLAGKGQLFDDPISAAVWLNVEASYG